MKKVTAILCATAFLAWGCNSSETKDSVEKADSTNKANMDSSSTNKPTVSTDAETSGFLVKAADAGMAEVQMGQNAQSKAMNPRVKDFAAMMVHDHSAANDKVKSFASQRNVMLPDSVSDDHKKMAQDLDKKKGKDFDKAYMDDMVKGHEKVVDMFEKANNNVNDTEVKNFINSTLPTIKAHLDSAKAIRKSLK